jgi:hypothetical protein
VGGGAYSTTLTNCTLLNNYARLGGGGASDAGLVNCLVVSNYCNNQGGGLYYSRAYYCTIVSNACWGEGGGTAYRMTSTNCVVYHNRSTVMGVDPNNYTFQSYFGYCCTYPDPGGPGNITNDPCFADFVGRNYRLSPASPCVDAATNMGLLVDMDGVPRPLDGNTNGVALPDMGAYEYAHPFGDTDGDSMTDPWELQYGLCPTNPADAVLDSDADTIDNRNEWIADTIPTNPNSYFVINAISNTPNCTVYFTSSTNRHYSLEYCTNLVDCAWTNLPEATRIQGKGGNDSLTDTNSAFLRTYRLRAFFP